MQNIEQKIIKETFGSKIINSLRLLFCQHTDDYVSYVTYIVWRMKVRDIIMIKTQSCGLLYSCISKLTTEPTDFISLSFTPA